MGRNDIKVKKKQERFTKNQKIGLEIILFGPNLNLKWTLNGPKMDLNGHKMDLKQIKNGVKINQKLTR